jgi:hypothetical protein
MPPMNCFVCSQNNSTCLPACLVLAILWCFLMEVLSISHLSRLYCALYYLRIIIRKDLNDKGKNKSSRRRRRNDFWCSCKLRKERDDQLKPFFCPLLKHIWKATDVRQAACLSGVSCSTFCIAGQARLCDSSTDISSTPGRPDHQSYVVVEVTKPASMTTNKSTEIDPKITMMPANHPTPPNAGFRHGLNHQLKVSH